MFVLDRQARLWSNMPAQEDQYPFFLTTVRGRRDPSFLTPHLSSPPLSPLLSSAIYFAVGYHPFNAPLLRIASTSASLPRFMGLLDPATGFDNYAFYFNKTVRE